MAWWLLAACGTTDDRTVTKEGGDPESPPIEDTSTGGPETGGSDTTTTDSGGSETGGETATGTWTGPCSQGEYHFQSVLTLDDDDGHLTGDLILYQYYTETTATDTSYSAYPFTIVGRRVGDEVTLKPFSTYENFDRVRFDLVLDGDALAGTMHWGFPANVDLPCSWIRQASGEIACASR